MSASNLPISNISYDQAVTMEVRIEGLSDHVDSETTFQPRRWLSAPFGPGWQLNVALWKDTSESDEDELKTSIYFAVSLKCWNQQRPLNVIVDINLKSPDGSVVTTGQFEHEMNPREDWGWTKFVAKKQFWHERSPVRRDNACIIEASVSTKSWFRPNDLVEGYLRSPAKLMLIRSLRDANVADTKFLLPACRPRDGVRRCAHIKAVYGNRAALKGLSPYFDSMLRTDDEPGFAEAALLKDIFEDSVDLTPFEEPYEYSSDSDLSDCSEETDQSKKIGEESVSKAHKEPSNFKRLGAVIPVKDVAYMTWAAMIYFLNTGEISFAPLKRHGENRVRCHNEEHIAFTPECPGAVSCKSTFRLADKLGIRELEDVALDYLRVQLTLDNIVDELFSKFTSRYYRVRACEIKFAVQNWTAVEASKKFQMKFNEFADGVLPQGRDVVQHLLWNVRPRPLLPSVKSKGRKAGRGHLPAADGWGGHAWNGEVTPPSSPLLPTHPENEAGLNALPYIPLL